MTPWPKVTLRLSILLLALGILPAVLIGWLFPQSDSLIPALLLLGVAPLGALALLVAVILYLATWFRRQ